MPEVIPEGDVSNKTLNQTLYENESRYTFYGLRNKNVDGVNKEIPVNTENIRSLRAKQSNSVLTFTPASFYEQEQRYVPFYTGRIYGFHVPDKVRKYREVNMYGDQAGLAGMSQFPANYTRKQQKSLIADKQVGGDL